MQEFDPYHQWLGIPPDEQPPTFYRLLGISEFEFDREVITEAAYRQIGHVKQYASGQHRNAATQILNELAKAQVILLNPKKKTQYDILIQEVTEEEEKKFTAVSPSVQAKANIESNSFEARGAAEIEQSKLPMLIGQILLLLGLVIFGFWWMLSSEGPTAETVVKNNAATAAADAQGSKPETTGASKTSERMASSETMPAENIPVETTESDEAKPAEIEPEETKNVDVKPTGESITEALIEKKPAVANLTEPKPLDAEADKKPKPNAPNKDPLEPRGMPKKMGHWRATQSVAFSPDGKRLISGSYYGNSKLWDVATEKELRIFKEGKISGGVKAVAFSPDGQKFVSTSHDNTLVLWNVNNGRKLRTFSAHSDIISDVAYSSNGQLIASGGKDGVRLWDATDQTQLKSLVGKFGAVNSVAFSPDGHQLIAGGEDGTVKRWSTITGKQLQPFTGHSRSIYTVAYSPNGKQIISGSGDRKLILWDVDSGQQLKMLAEDRVIDCVAFSPDGRQLVSGSGSNIEIWNVESGRVLESFYLRGPVKSVSFSPDGKRVVSGGFDSIIRIWELGKVGKPVPTIVDSELVLSGHKSGVACASFIYPGGHIISGGKDGTIRIWDAVNGDELQVLREHSAAVTSLAVSQSGRDFVSGSEDKTAIAWDHAAGNKPLGRVTHSGPVTCVASSKIGHDLVSGSSDQTVKKWFFTKSFKTRVYKELNRSISSVATCFDGNLIASSDLDGTIACIDDRWREAIYKLKGSKGFGASLTFSDDDKWLAAGGHDGKVRFWDTKVEAKDDYKIGSVVKTFTSESLSGKINCVAFSADSKRIASCSASGMVNIWNVASGKELMTYEQNGEDIRTVEFSPDGNRLVITYDKSIKILDIVSTVKQVLPLKTLRGHSDAVAGIAFSSDGKRFVSANADKTLRIWDAENGQQLKTFDELDLQPVSVTFSPDDQWILNGTESGEIQLWDIAAGTKLKTLTGHQSEVEQVAFSPNGKQIASASKDGFVKLWRVTNGKAKDLNKEKSEPYTSVAFSPNGRWVVTGNSDNSVKIWSAK